jgi:K+-sensing histidine kinase KdpD
MIINDFAMSLIEQNTVDEIIWDIAKNAIAKLDFLDCVIYLFDDQGQLVQRAAHGPKSPEYIDIRNPITIQVGEGIVGNVALTGQPELIEDTSIDPRYIVDDAFRLSEIAVPIKIGNEVIGVIDSEHPEKNFYSIFHLDILMTIASMVATKIQQAKAQEELELYKKNLESIIEEKTKTLTQTLERLERSNKTYEQFNTVLSYDLLEPLRMISGHVQLLNKRHRKDLPEEAQEYINYAVTGAKKIDTLIKDLLSYSKIGRTNTPFVDVNIQKILEHLEKNLATEIHDSGSFILYQEMPTIKARNTLMFLLFQSLIENAIKFRAEETPIIEVSVIEKEFVWEFCVKDNGIGLPQDEESRKGLFDVFEQFTVIEDTSSMGLGLAVARNIVQQHYGNIWAENNKDKGSSFFFTITK